MKSFFNTAKLGREQVVKNSRSRRIRTIRGMGLDGDIIVKKLTLPGGVISSGAGGAIAVTTQPSGSVQSDPATEWASFAARYQQYRVRAFRIVNCPVNTVNTATINHGQLFISDSLGSSTPGSAAQILSDERAVIVSTAEKWVYVADWSRNPNAKLWNPTSAIIPTANTYSISLGSTATLSVNTPYLNVSYEYMVEFRGSQ